MGSAFKALKDNSFLDEAFGFIDKCGAKPRIFNQNQSQKILTLPLTENRGFSPRFIYGRRSLPSKKDFYFKEFDFNDFDLIFVKLNYRRKERYGGSPTANANGIPT